MTIVPIMWSVWGALVLVMAVLYMYRASVSKNEEDQLFLSDSNQKVAQAAILDKVHKVQPIVRGASWLLGIATLFVVGYYIVDVINQFK
jgi:hypothetical protein